MKDPSINIFIDKWQHIESVVNLHTEYLPSNYPKNELFKKLLFLYYQTCRDDRHNKLVSAEIDGKMVGYVCLINSLNKLYLKMIGYNILFMVPILVNFIYYQKKYFLRKILNKIFIKNNKYDNKKNQCKDLNNIYELRPIIVIKDYQGTTVAQKLLSKAEEFLVNKGEKYYFLRVYQNNVRALKFYNRNGFDIIRAEGEQLVLVKTLQERPSVLITTQVFPPEIHPSAVMVQELAKDMSHQGWQVTVAAGYPHHPYGRIYPDYTKKFLSIENNNGFRVVRGWHVIHPGSGTIPRTLVMLSQACAYFFEALAFSRADVIISYGPALIGPFISSLIANRKHAKLMTLIYDIYPDIAIEMGYLKNPILIDVARQLEKLVYRWSDRIGVLSEGFRQTLIEEKGVDPQKVALIPVWLDVRDIVPMTRNNPWRQEVGISSDTFVVLYAGTIGLISGAEMVLDAANLLKSYQDILFLFVGAGYARDRVEAKAQELGLKNIRFLPFQPRERLSEVQATADVSLVTLLPGRGKTSVPSKVLGYMAAARPVIAAVDQDCDTAALIRTAACGRVVPPMQPEVLSEAILHFYHLPEERKIAGEKGEAYFKNNFERRQVMKKYIDIVVDLATSRT